ncbi:hypothetical protein AMJ47_01690 [Parcubacteria bacterium DG_72]|nr:MAG: hypothetical protein AMJ47_01690 [Parcubacteria bacterium DG_72]
MCIFLNIVVFLFGLAVGSFLNCIIYRLELKEFKKKKKPFLRGRSFCPSCKHVLAWYDLIPVVSFFILRRKCRYCSKKISWQYPAVEIATALLFLSIFNFQELLITSYWLLITCLLIIIFVYDLKHFIIPDSLVFLAIGVTFLYNLITNYGLLITNYLIFGLVVAAFFFAIFALSRGRWMGFGDVKLAFFMGLFLGFPATLVALFFSFLIGAIIGIILILLKKKGLKSEVPFGPFLILGTYIGLFWGDKIVNWYLNILTY